MVSADSKIREAVFLHALAPPGDSFPANELIRHIGGGCRENKLKAAEDCRTPRRFAMDVPNRPQLVATRKGQPLAGLAIIIPVRGFAPHLGDPGIADGLLRFRI